MQNLTESLVRLGRFMITNAPKLADDVTCNNWARVGQQLTGLGMPFAPRLREFPELDQRVVREAAAVMTGKAAMPALLEVNEPTEPRRTRKARMTKVMTKPAKVVKPAKPAKAPKAAKPAKAPKQTKATPAGEPKRRGRPPGSKNKAKAVAAPAKSK